MSPSANHSWRARGSREPSSQWFHASSPVRGYSVNMPGGPGTLAAALHQEEHWYIDVASQGHTIDEALANLAEAVELYLEEVTGSG
jgi:hypothetical protein